MTWVDLGGVRLRLSDRRPADAERGTIVLIHGWKQSHRLFDRLALKLVDRGYRVIAFDHRGMGESDKPDGPYDFNTLASDLARVLEVTDASGATLFGWSMGCSVALEYLRTHPDGARRVILHNGPIRLTTTDGFTCAMPEEQLSGYLVDMEARWPESEMTFLAESLLPKNRAALTPWLYTVSLQTPFDVALKTVRNQVRLDHRDVVRNLSVPVLALYSELDPYYPTSLAEWIAAHAIDGRAVLVDDSAHCGPLEEPDRMAEIIHDFISGAPDA